MNARCGYIAILGEPNAGKSTLLNRLAGGKVAIVTPKAQTTRGRILGIAVREQAQLIFIDTPGIFLPKQGFETAMVNAAWQGAREADVLLVLIDAAYGFTKDTEAILTRAREYGKPFCVAINKVDKIAKPNLLALAHAVAEHSAPLHCFMISAISGDGVESMAGILASLLPEGPFLFPEDEMTTVPMRELAAEITREQLFLKLREELPYALWVTTEQFEERKDGSIRIAQRITVEREGQKAIVLGQKGQMLKSIGIAARQEIARVLARQTHLSLFVKVDAKWKDSAEVRTAYGFE